MSHPFRSRRRRSYHLRRHRVRLPYALTDPLRVSLGELTGPTSFVIRGTGDTVPVCSAFVAFPMFAIFPGENSSIWSSFEDGGWYNAPTISPENPRGRRRGRTLHQRTSIWLLFACSYSYNLSSLILSFT